MFLLQICQNTIAVSKIDCISQHTAIADYFRKHFYETHNLFPQYTAELGGGQNIYYFAYYGLYNPLYLLSWLFPFVSMETWFQMIGFVTLTADGILGYLWLNRHVGKRESLIGSLMLMLSYSVIYHTATQVMFVNYLPFLLLMLIGVEIREQTGKGTLLSAGTVGLILTSFYFVPSGIAAIGVYVIGRQEKGLTRKEYLKILIWKFLPIFKAVLFSSFYLVPVGCALMMGRGEKKSINGWELLIPDISAKKYFYHPYGLGLTSMAFIILGIWMFGKRRKEKNMTCLMLLIFVFPIFAWVLNGGLYARSKVFLPFLPIICLICAEFFEKLGKNEISGKQIVKGYGTVSLALIIGNLSLRDREMEIMILDLIFCGIALFISYRRKKHLAEFVTIAMMLSMSTVMTCQNLQFLVTKDFNHQLHDLNTKQAVQTVLKNEIQRFRMEVRGEAPYEKANQNRIWAAGQNLTTCYSSLSNSEYTKFRSDIGLSKSTRNCFMQDMQDNPLFLRFMGVKYLVGGKEISEWKKMEGEGQSAIYQNDKVAPIAYLTNQTLSEKQFADMSWNEKQLILLERAVVPNGEKVMPSVLEDIKVNVENKTSKGNSILGKKQGIQVQSAKPLKSILKMNRSTKKGEFIFLSFQIENHCKTKDVSVLVEGIKNKLSSKNADYYNKNEVFHYTLDIPEGTRELSVTFGAGNYELKNLKCQVGCVDERKNQDLYQNAVDLKLNRSGDGYNGKLKSQKNQWLITSIPFDKNFKVIIDGKYVEVKKVNGAFLGVQVPKGFHIIRMKYWALGSKEGMGITGIAVLAGGICKRCRRKRQK